MLVVALDVSSVMAVNAGKYQVSSGARGVTRVIDLSFCSLVR